MVSVNVRELCSDGDNFHQFAKLVNAKRLVLVPDSVVTGYLLFWVLSFPEAKKFRFLQVSEIEVFLLLESLHTKTSTGINKVHPLLLNLPINQSIFPDSMKLAIVVLIFKQGSRPFPVLFK